VSKERRRGLFYNKGLEEVSPYKLKPLVLLILIIMSGMTAEFQRKIADREQNSFRVQPSRVRTNEDRERDKEWEAVHRPKVSSAGLPRHEKRRLRNKRTEYPQIGIKGSSPSPGPSEMSPLLTRTPLFEHSSVKVPPRAVSPGPASGHRGKPTSPRPLNLQTMPIRLEAQVLENLVGTGKVLGIDFPPRLPAARHELMNLNSVLDDLIDSIRSAMTRYYETSASTLIATRKLQQEREEEGDHRLLTASLQRGAGVEADEDFSLHVAFDTVLGDLIRQSVKKTRRIQSFYNQHVLRVEEDCNHQLAKMQEILADFKLKLDTKTAQVMALQFSRQIDSTAKLRQGIADLNQAMANEDCEGSIADCVSVCLAVDPSKSHFAKLAKQIAEQLTVERADSLKIITDLTGIILYERLTVKNKSSVERSSRN